MTERTRRAEPGRARSEGTAVAGMDILIDKD